MTSPELDARLLLCAAAGLDRSVPIRDPDLSWNAEAASRFEAFLERRLAREPVSRILGFREFWGLNLRLTPDVLDPRPDTETLVEAVLEAVKGRLSHPWRILDLGTGSGAILLSLSCTSCLKHGAGRSTVRPQPVVWHGPTWRTAG